MKKEDRTNLAIIVTVVLVAIGFGLYAWNYIRNKNAEKAAENLVPKETTAVRDSDSEGAADWWGPQADEDQDQSLVPREPMRKSILDQSETETYTIVIPSRWGKSFTEIVQEQIDSGTAEVEPGLNPLWGG